MTSRAAEIASDLRDALEQASLPLVCRVRRSYVPRSDRDDLERATLTVAPLSATLARRMKDLPRAQKDIAQALTRSADDANVQLEAGNIAAVAGDEAAARKAWSQAAQLAPPDSPIRAEVAKALAQFPSR